MSLPIVFRPIAKLEMDESVAWYENQRLGLGLQFADEVESVLNRISQAPEQFKIVRGDARRAVLSQFPYTLHFIPEQHRIVVLAVFHVKRNPKRLEGR
jgi:toxin ParE1/3/4